MIKADVKNNCKAKRRVSCETVLFMKIIINKEPASEQKLNKNLLGRCISD